MTLIQTLITPTHVLQVSDRRLTRPDGSLFNDAHNKATTWCGLIAVGFTGLAFIDRPQRKPVAEWLAETLWKIDGWDEGITRIQTEVRAAIARLPRSWPDKRLSITLAGFGHDPQSGGVLKPLAARVSNFENLEQVWPSHQDDFYLNRMDVSRRNFVYLTSGAALTSWERRVADKRIRRLMSRDGELNRVVRLMVMVQRHVNDRDSTVGRDAMVVSLPTQQYVLGSMMTNIESIDIDPNSAMFSFISDEGLTHVTFGPNFVCGHTAVGDVKAEMLGGNPDNQSISIRFLKDPPPGTPDR